MSFDGMAEADGINARISHLVSGQVWEGAVPDGHTLATFSDGRIKPYIITKFGTPVASSRDRLLAADEQGQPHVFSGTIAAYAADPKTARSVMSAVTKLLVAWAPNDTIYPEGDIFPEQTLLPDGAQENSSPIRLLGGYSYTKAKSASAPARFEQGVFFECIINLSTS